MRKSENKLLPLPCIKYQKMNKTELTQLVLGAFEVFWRFYNGRQGGYGGGRWGSSVTYPKA